LRRKKSYIQNNILIAYNLLLMLFIAKTVFASDWQFWNAYSVEGKIAKSWNVKVEEELRFGDDISRLMLHQTDIGFTYAVADWFDAGIHYRQIYEKKAGDWKEENRSHVSGTFKWTWYDLAFSDRNSVEFRNREDAKDIWRYRNRLTLTLPAEWTRFSIQPYVSDEIFIVDGSGVNQNRLSAGLKMKALKHLKSILYYVWRTDENEDEWDDTNVIGLKLGFVF
jgi:hypothetical protein